MIPENITKEHIERAIQEIDEKGIRKGRHSSTYDLSYKGKSYPPKLVLSIANRYANGSEIDPKDFEGGKDTQAFELLLKQGFEIIPKNNETETPATIDNLIKLLKHTGHENAIIFFNNARQFLNSLDIKQGDTRVTYGTRDNKRFSITIGQRYCLALMPSIKLPWEFISETTISNTGEIEVGKFDGEPIAYYYHCLNSDEMTNRMEGIVKAAKVELNRTEKSGYRKHNNDLFEKAIFDNAFRTQLFEQAFNSENYWVFQGNPDQFDFETAFKENLIDAWTVSAHKDKIKPGDKVIIWITGKNAGVYALAEITSTPHELIEERDTHLWKKEDNNPLKAGLKFTHKLFDKPLLSNEIKTKKELEKLNVGLQGTNFSATKEQYQKILEMATEEKNIQYWLYAPGEKANKWDEFYTNGIMALGWDELGDLKQYKTRDEIKNSLIKAYGGDGSKMNDVSANDDLINKVNIGDIIIAKKGRGELLGYGIVTSDYIYDSNRNDYRSSRKVDWKLKGNWKVDFSLALKTLTDITKYSSDNPNYDTYYNQLLGIMNNQTSEIIKETTHPLNTILYGPPGTGKTYNSIDKAVEIVTGQSTSNHDENKKQFDELRKQGQIEFVTFHQNYSYEDFMVGLRPDVEFEQLRFKSYKGIFYEIAKRAKDNYLASKEHLALAKSFDEAFNEIIKPLLNDNKGVEITMASGVKYTITDVSDTTIHFTKPSGGNQHTLSIQTLEDLVEGVRNVTSGLVVYYTPLANLIKEKRKPLANAKKENTKKYVLIIDEINRANISKVFGELITLLEDDKRLGEPNELKITLPNGEKEFGVPPNLYIIGTMNTADKSIALIDIALRRRFEFVGYYPIYEGYNDSASKLLKKINEAIYEKKKSADYLIGHAYFMKNQSIETVLKNKVLPLLLEYFSGKTDIVSSIFNDTDWSVNFNTSNYGWDISNK